MTLFIFIFLYSLSLIMKAEGEDWERSEAAKERRHKELMLREKDKRERRVIKRDYREDHNGNKWAQELIQEEIYG